MLRPEYYRFLWSTAKNLHRSQAKSLIAVVVCLVTCGRMRSFDTCEGIRVFALDSRIVDVDTNGEATV